MKLFGRTVTPAMLRFVVVTALFTLAFVAMVLLEVASLWWWIAFVALWTVVEWAVARDVHLRWWQWGLILVGLGLIDLIVLTLRG